jgi:hypothetical protein
VVCFFLVLDEEGDTLTHHLPRAFRATAFLLLPRLWVCRLIEAKTTSKQSETENFRSTNKSKNGMAF